MRGVNPTDLASPSAACQHCPYRFRLPDGTGSQGKGPGMTDSPGQRPSDAASEPAEGLARSYQAFLEDKAWDVEVAEESGPEVGAGASVNTPSLLHLVEALLFVGGVPLTAESATAAIRGLTPAQFTQAIASLNDDYRRQGRPYVVQAHGQGYS